MQVVVKKGFSSALQVLKRERENGEGPFSRGKYKGDLVFTKKEGDGLAIKQSFIFVVSL